MNKSIRMFHEHFESSSVLTPEFASFARTFKREFKKFIESIGGEKVEIGREHFYLSGFFTYQGQIWYINVGDVRWSKDGYIRTAKHYKDWRGGANQWLRMDTGDDFMQSIKSIIGA